MAKFIGRHELGDYIGAGAYSSVWTVRDTITGAGSTGGDATDANIAPRASTNAIKVYTSADEPHYFLNEVKVLNRVASLQSPWLIKMHEAGMATDMSDGYPRLIPFILLSRHGPALDKVLENYELDIGQITAIARCVFSGLAALHSAGVIHADIKPENILARDPCDVAEWGQSIGGTNSPSVPAGATAFVIADLGTSVYQGERVTDMVGTPEYLAPEVVLGLMWGAPYDIWGAFSVVYSMITNTPLTDIYGDYGVIYGDDVDGHAMEGVEIDSASDDSEPDALAFRTLILMTKVLGPMPAQLIRRARKYVDATGQPIGHPVEPCDIITMLLTACGRGNTTNGAAEMISAADFLDTGLRWLVSDRPTATATLNHPWLAELALDQ